MINTQYIRQLFKHDTLHIIIPTKRINFKRVVNGEVLDKLGNGCKFDCCNYCWKMDVPTNIVWL